MYFRALEKKLATALKLMSVVGCLGMVTFQSGLALAQTDISNQVGDGNNINGNVSGSQVSAQNTKVNVGGATNTNSSLSLNQNQNQVITPTQSISTGGSSALVLPRNPLTLPNAALGRSNFGLQFGLNNNPGFSNIFGSGVGNALGWFLQGGVNIPFGKIPDIIANPKGSQLDDLRQQRLENDRQVFGSVQNNNNSNQGQANVQGRVVSLNAYNYSTAASPKVEGLKDSLRTIEAEKNLAVPKVLALVDADVYSKPLGKGEKVGKIQTGEEYRYIGHTNSGWVKLVLINGKEGWAKSQFEYLKNDYTEIDTVTLHNVNDGRQADGLQGKPQLSLSNSANRSIK